MWNILLELFFPKQCCACGKVGSFLCQNCINEITQTNLVCPTCERASIGGVTHPICKRKYGLDGLWYLGTYDYPLKQAIQKLKYKFIEEISTNLIDLLLEYWARHQPLLLEQLKKDNGKSWVVVPVPLHKRRQNWRGFNQSALLAKQIAGKLGLPYEEVLIRTKFTKPQMNLKSNDRKQNIKGAFALKGESTINEKKILIIDDVWTTGSTLKECTYILKRTGAKTIWAITIAR